MNKELRWHDYLTININWFGLTTRSQVLTPLVIPLLIQQFVGESLKGTYLGTMRLWALMAALLIQALMGLLSDRNTSRFGRRRPFIVGGVVLEIIIIILIGLSAQLEGMTGYWVLFGLYIFSMVGSNMSHAATQGLIPDLVPDEHKGMASGIKAILELPLPLIFASFVIAKMIEQGNIWGALISLIVILIISMSITMLNHETPLQETPPPIDWQPIIRLIAMTGLFTLVILIFGKVVSLFLPVIQDLPDTSRLLLSGLAGLIGMGLAVFIGVIASLRISLGSEIADRQSFMWWVVNRLAFLVAANNLSSFILYFLQEKFPEYPGTQVAGPASKIIMFVGIFILLSALPSGWLADRFGKKILIATAGVLVAVGAAIVILAPALNAVLYLGASLVGAGVGLFYSANWALGTKIVPPKRAGEFLGLSNLAGAGAGAIGAYIGGPIADSASYVLLMSIYGLMALLSTLALFGIKET